MEIIKPSTVTGFTVDFELQILLSNCGTIHAMTPCLDTAYDNLIGSDINDKLKRKMNLTGSLLQGIG